MNENADKTKRLKMYLNDLFRNQFGDSIGDQLNHISDYFTYLAECIDYMQFKVNGDRNLLQSFESVYLWLQDKLSIFPENIKKQIVDIVTDKNLCDIMAVLSNISEKELWRIRRMSGIGFPSKIIFSFLGTKVELPAKDKEYVTKNSLFETQLALRRLSQLIKYASSINFIDYDESIKDFKDNYNPELINKNKILTLVNYLKVQIDTIPDDETKKKVSDKLEALETELKKSKVRWGVVITGFFVLFGFFADMRTLKPDIYEKPIEIIQSILHTLHNDSLVQSNKPNLLELSMKNRDVNEKDKNDKKSEKEEIKPNDQPMLNEEIFNIDKEDKDESIK